MGTIVDFPAKDDAWKNKKGVQLWTQVYFTLCHGKFMLKSFFVWYVLITFTCTVRDPLEKSFCCKSFLKSECFFFPKK